MLLSTELKIKIGHYRKFLKLTFWMSQLYHYIRGFSTAIPKILFAKPQQSVGKRFPSVKCHLCFFGPFHLVPPQEGQRQNKTKKWHTLTPATWWSKSCKVTIFTVTDWHFLKAHNYTFTITSTISSNMIGALADLLFTNNSVQLYVEQCKGWCLWCDHLNVLKK